MCWVHDITCRSIGYYAGGANEGTDAQKPGCGSRQDDPQGCRPRRTCSGACEVDPRHLPGRRGDGFRFVAPIDQKACKIALKVNDCRTRSEEHTSELQSLMRISYAVF